MVLHSRISGRPAVDEPGILRVRESRDGLLDSSNDLLLVDQVDAALDPSGVITLTRNPLSGRIPSIPEELGYLTSGDIVRLDPQGNISVLYRKNSPHNSNFITERCNSRCVMCSQPPRQVDDSYLIAEWLKAIPLMSLETKELGITGGEPTLEFEGVLKLLEVAKEHLPSTAVHMLTNVGTTRYVSRLIEFKDQGENLPGGWRDGAA